MGRAHVEQEDLRRLARTPWLADLAPEDRELAAARARVRRLEPRQILFHQGDPADAFFFLSEGRIKLTQISPEGQEIVVRFLASGEIFAAIALLPGRSYPVTAQAVVASRVLVWSGPDLEELTTRAPRVVLAATQAMADHMEEVTGRLRELSTQRVAERVGRTLLRLAAQTGRAVEGGTLLDLPLTRQDLAEMTGTTLYSVSRLLSAWEAEGLVASGRGRVVLRSPEALAARVGAEDDLPETPG